MNNVLRKKISAIGLVALVFSLAACAPSPVAEIGIIGGADGPTVIYSSGRAPGNRAHVAGELLYDDALTAAAVNEQGNTATSAQHEYSAQMYGIEVHCSDLSGVTTYLECAAPHGGVLTAHVEMDMPSARLVAVHESGDVQTIAADEHHGDVTLDLAAGRTRIALAADRSSGTLEVMDIAAQGDGGIELTPFPGIDGKGNKVQP